MWVCNCHPKHLSSVQTHCEYPIQYIFWCQGGYWAVPFLAAVGTTCSSWWLCSIISNKSMVSDYHPSFPWKDFGKPRETWFCGLCLWLFHCLSYCPENSCWPETWVSPYFLEDLIQVSISLGNHTWVTCVGIELLISWTCQGYNDNWLTQVLWLACLDASCTAMDHSISLRQFLWQSQLGKIWLLIWLRENGRGYIRLTLWIFYLILNTTSHTFP